VKLTDLRLGTNYIEDISILSGLADVTTLYLHTNYISDISSLTSLTNLTRLELQNNYLYLDPVAYTEYLPKIQQNNLGMTLIIDDANPPSNG
jgi:hypothetical protein